AVDSRAGYFDLHKPPFASERLHCLDGTRSSLNDELDGRSGLSDWSSQPTVFSACLASRVSASFGPEQQTSKCITTPDGGCRRRSGPSSRVRLCGIAPGCGPPRRWTNHHSTRGFVSLRLFLADRLCRFDRLVLAHRRHLLRFVLVPD